MVLVVRSSRPVVFPGVYSGFGGQGFEATVKQENHQKPRKNTKNTAKSKKTQKTTISNDPSKSSCYSGLVVKSVKPL